MKKLLLSATVAAMALSTTASALEDVKFTGGAKLWYETSDKNSGDLFKQNRSSGESVFNLGMTGKQGNIGFGAKFYQSSTMGLEGEIVSGTRTNNGSEMYTGEMYFTAPAGSATTLKVGKQELNTPFAFTEKWNAAPNTFNAIAGIIKASDALTVVAAYVGQTNSTTAADTFSFKANDEVDQAFFNGALAAGFLYATDSLGVNFWTYQLADVAGSGVAAHWLDVELKGTGLKVYVANVGGVEAATDKATTGYALSYSGKAGDLSYMVAASQVSEDGDIALGNVATGSKKSMLPTEGVYTDGLYVAQPDSTAVKVKVGTKVGGMGLTLQAVQNSNTKTKSKETTEIDLIAKSKVGEFDVTAIVMNRSFDLDSEETANGGMYVRAVVGLNF